MERDVESLMTEAIANVRAVGVRLLIEGREHAAEGATAFADMLEDAWAPLMPRKRIREVGLENRKTRKRLRAVGHLEVVP